MKKILLILTLLFAGIKGFSQNNIGVYTLKTIAEPSICGFIIETRVHGYYTSFYYIDETKPIEKDSVSTDKIISTVNIDYYSSGPPIYNCPHVGNVLFEGTNISSYLNFVELEGDFTTYEPITIPSDFRFYIYPKRLCVYSRNPLTNMQNMDLPTDDKIELSSNTGFYSGTYKWCYSFNPGYENSWIELPPQFQNKDTIQFSGRDLFGDTVMNIINKNVIYFSVRPNLYYPTQEELNEIYHIMPLYIKLSSPHIDTVRFEMPSCHGKQDAKLIIQFDRNLYSDNYSGSAQQPAIHENIHISLYDTVFHEKIDTVSELDPVTFEYIINDLSADTLYKISIIGVMIYDYGNGNTDTMFTYTIGYYHYDTITIPDRSALKMESISADSVHCYGGADGKIHIKVSGGVDKFNAYLTNDAATYSDTIKNFVSNADAVFSDLPAGNYTVSIVDTNDCYLDSAGHALIYDIEVKQPADPVAINGYYDWEEPKCFGNADGWAQIYFDGGTSPYTVEWKDSTGAIIPNTIMPDGDRYLSKVENIRAGKYFITVRDSHYSLATPETEVNRCGCYDTMTIFVPEPPLLKVAIKEIHYVTCYGDSDGVIVAHGIGGRPFASGNPYKYEWSIVNGNFNMPVGFNDSVLSDIPAGVYQVKITDRNLICVALDTFKLVQPDSLVVEAEVLQNVLCNGENTGAITTTVKGGTPPYTYIWSNGETTPEIHNLSMGGYVVYVRDARFADNGILGHYCTAQDQAFITSPNGIEFNATLIHPTCNAYSDGSIMLKVTGGLTPYSYSWDDGSSESGRTGLSAGVYTVAVTDANGCIISQTYTLSDPDPVIVDLGKDITLCKNQTVTINGNINITNANYEWTDGQGAVLSIFPEYELSKAGTYRLTVTTAEGCFGSDEIVVSQSDDEIDVDFVIATKIANNTKLYAVNITRLSLDEIEWIIPNDAILYEQTDDRIQLSFPRNGTYIVGLKGYKGLCEKTMYKTISVVDKSEITEDESAEPFLKRFIAVPNPNDGNFDVIIELREAAEFRLVLYDMSGAIVETTPTYNAISQTIPFSRSVISAGTYLLKFVSSKTTSTFKVIIQ
ncbi:MAG: T9SS type A sorting domain-containing protein [Prevotellaceae bacterium]|jgi:hypothetical protein|nr:T9SS type A sorting domain-containing protein [Prevotellaceae bacterium]